jgi:pimeloyl-ACP methyl ester carboxylesterase
MLTVVMAAALLAAPATVPQAVTFKTDDGWTIHADLYGSGDRGLVLVHGGRFTKASWRDQARELTDAGFRVLAIDMRGFGLSKEGPTDAGGFGSPADVAAAVRYLRQQGATSVSLLGGSMGGAAAADAAATLARGEVDRVVMLGAHASVPPEKLTFRKLYIATRDDRDGSGTPRLPRVQAEYEKAPEPKEILVLDGSAHAQFLFQTKDGPRVMREIRRFLTAP